MNGTQLTLPLFETDRQSDATTPAPEPIDWGRVAVEVLWLLLGVRIVPEKPPLGFRLPHATPASRGHFAI